MAQKVAKSGSKFKLLVKLAIGGTLSFGGICLAYGNEQFYSEVFMPLARMLPPETAHRLAVLAAKHNIVPWSNYTDPDILKTNVWGINFKNPIGLAAGFDKNGEAYLGLLKLGFGFVEIGSVTPEPQPGNPQPRLFRLLEDRALINRYGFNSNGHNEVGLRLELNFFDRMVEKGILGINLGKNKTSEDAVQDYVKGIKNLAMQGDYLVINISSPNTPGLRSLQDEKSLDELLDEVIKARNELEIYRKPPLLIKISPDLSEKELKSIAKIAMLKGVDGLIISNTTTSRPSELLSPEKEEEGGLSGAPLRDMSTRVVRTIYEMTNGKIPIIGVGGVSTGLDAYEKIKSGASLVQIYTSLVYDGPPVVTKIKRELEELLREDGYASIADAVGADCEKSSDKPVGLGLNFKVFLSTFVISYLISLMVKS